MGLFDQLKQGLQKTTRLLKTDVRDLFKAEGRLVDEDLLEELLEALVLTDMGFKPARAITQKIGSEYRGRVVGWDAVLETVKAELKEILCQEESPIRFADQGPTVILVAGVNGAGKTTSIAKLAKRMIDDGKSVVLGAGDTFRAAAVEQLSIWADRIGAQFIKGDPGSDPASVAYRTVEAAIANKMDVCIVDTAGRLQTQKNLMQELEKIKRSISKQIPTAPHESLLVIDATTGQNGISQTTHFSDAIDCTGIVLAKLDGSAKGGVVVAIREQVGVPVKYVGVGEKFDDLAVFSPDAYVDALFADVSDQPSNGATTE
ncbi:MAG: signal recognition particle-docking protein FtsY [Planctomycetota bacterium]|nr:signal recognition particle-docking protein FtsY [Planctomycetota bacterium]